MDKDMLEKSMADLRLARATLAAMHEEIGSGRATADQAFNEAQCKLAMAIVLSGGSNWICESVFPDASIKLAKIVRGAGGMNITSLSIYSRRNYEHGFVSRLQKLLTNKADDAEVAAALTEVHNRLHSFRDAYDKLIAVRGRFFRFVDGKYEVMC